MQCEKNFPVRKRAQSGQGIVTWLCARQNFGNIEGSSCKGSKVQILEVFF